MFQCRDLLRGFEYECIKGSTDVAVSEVVNDSRKITEGCLFICIHLSLIHISSPLRLVGLCHDGRHLMTCLYERLERPH